MTRLVVILSLVMILMPNQLILCPKFLECSATCENLDGFISASLCSLTLSGTRRQVCPIYAWPQAQVILYTAIDV